MTMTEVTNKVINNNRASVAIESDYSREVAETILADIDRLLAMVAAMTQELNS